MKASQSVYGATSQGVGFASGNPRISPAATPEPLGASSQTQHIFTETSPLIQGTHSHDNETLTAPSLDARGYPAPGKRKWPPSLISFASFSLLSVSMVLILFLGYIVPEAARQYSDQAGRIRLKGLSVDSFTTNGARIRVQAEVAIDSSRVDNSFSRNVGRLLGSVVHQAQLGSATVTVFLPDYQKVKIGTVTYPDIVLDLRDGRSTEFDMLCHVIPDNFDNMKQVVSDYFSGFLDTVRVRGEARIPLRSGIFPLGTRMITHELVLNNVPKLPNPDISQIEISQVKSHEQTALNVNATVSIANNFPLDIDLPSLGFSVMLPSCDKTYVEVGIARTAKARVSSYSPIVVSVQGIVESIPFPLVQICSDTGKSPLDDILGQYVNGPGPTIYIKGLPLDRNDNNDIPAWLGESLASVVVPFQIPGGRTFDNLIKSFSLTDVNFRLPDLNADPDSQDSFPCISATILAVAKLPSELRAPMEVSRLKANADVLYKKEKFGEFHVSHWIPAQTTQHQETQELEIRSRVVDVPLNITDADIFSEVVQKIIFGGDEGVVLEVLGAADAEVNVAALGAFTIRGIPARGDITVKGGMYGQGL